MIGMAAFCRPLLASLALLTAAIAVSVTPASARPHHGASRQVHTHHAIHHTRWHHVRHHSRHRYRHVAAQSRWERNAAQIRMRGLAANSLISVTPDAASSGQQIRHPSRHRYRHAARQSRWERGVAQMRTRGLADSHASVAPAAAAAAGPGSSASSEAGTAASSGSGLVADARRYLGGNPTGRGSLWCARFMNMVLQHNGYRGTGSDMANSFASYGTRISGPQVGAIAVMSRGRRGGHVGIVTGVDAKGNPVVISGNNGNRVREAPVSRGRIYAYVRPTS